MATAGPDRMSYGGGPENHSRLIGIGGRLISEVVAKALVLG